MPSLVERTSCPACGAAQGVACEVWINGERKPWTHDARILVDLRADIEAEGKAFYNKVVMRRNAREDRA